MNVAQKPLKLKAGWEGTDLLQTVAYDASRLQGKSYSQMAQTTIGLTNLKDSQYVGRIGVGSNKDPINVVFDTGSTNIWIASTFCKEGSCLKHKRYDAPTSHSFVNSKHTLDVTFGTGNLKGRLAVDDFTIGPYQVKGQNFALIEKETGFLFEKIDFEGICGLAFQKMAAHGFTPIFDNIVNQKLMQRYEFSFFFTRLPDSSSAVFFGGVDPRFYEGDIRMFPVVEQYYWMVRLKDVFVGDYRIDGPKLVLFDTGTTYFTTPKTLTPSVLKHMPRTKCHDVLSGAAKLPDLRYQLYAQDDEVVEIRIPAKEYYVGGTDGACDPAWMSIEVPSPHGPAYILGEVFMRSYYTVFDRGDDSHPGFAQVGIAKAVHDEKAMAAVRSLRGGGAVNGGVTTGDEAKKAAEKEKAAE